MNCYLCQSDDLVLVRDRLRHDVERKVFACSNCGLNYLEPLHSEAELQDYYAEDYRNQYSPKTEEAANFQAIFDIYSPLQVDRIKRRRPGSFGFIGEIKEAS